RHLLRALLGLARACQRLGPRRCLPVLPERPAGDAGAWPLSRAGLRRKRRLPAHPLKETTMKLVTYRTSVEAEARLGVIDGVLVVGVGGLGGPHGEDLPDSMLGMIDMGRPGLDALRDCLDEAEGRHAPGTATALANVKLLAPIPR